MYTLRFVLYMDLGIEGPMLWIIVHVSGAVELCGCTPGMPRPGTDRLRPKCEGWLATDD